MTFEEKARKLWPHFIFSFGLSDHLGDAADTVRRLADLLDLPMPSGSAELCGAEEDAPEDSWTGWARQQGAGRGLWSVEPRDK